MRPRRFRILHAPPRSRWVHLLAAVLALGLLLLPASRGAQAASPAGLPATDFEPLRGTVEQVDLSSGRMVVQGRRFGLDAARLRVIEAEGGRALEPTRVRPGSRVRLVTVPGQPSLVMLILLENP